MICLTRIIQNSLCIPNKLPSYLFLDRTGADKVMYQTLLMYGKMITETLNKPALENTQFKNPIIRLISVVGVLVFFFIFSLPYIARADQKTPQQTNDKDKVDTKESSGKQTGEVPNSLNEALKSTLKQLKTENLPTNPIIEKAREGVAKGVDEKRIVQTCGRLASYLRESLKFLKKHKPLRKMKQIPPGLLRAYAEARLSGVTKTEISNLFSASQLTKRWKTTAHSLYVLADLKISGYPGVEASKVIAFFHKSRDAGALQNLKGVLSQLHLKFGLSKTEAILTVKVSLTRHKNPTEALRGIRHGYHRRHRPDKSNKTSKPGKPSR